MYIGSEEEIELQPVSHIEKSRESNLKSRNRNIGMVLIPKSSCERTGNAYYFLEGGNQEEEKALLFFKKRILSEVIC